MHQHREALMTDLHQLKMAAGYFHDGLHRRRVSFELAVRRLPADRRYLVFAGLERVLGYLGELRFSESQIAYMRQIPGLRQALTFELVEYLRDFRFRGDVWAMPEGTIAFANEPLLRVTGNLLEAQLVETFLLSAINTETLVASKAARIVRAADGADVLELGTRRTSPEEAVASARAAFIAGFAATSNLEAGYRYDMPLAGTFAHSWVMSHGSEEESFRRFVERFPDDGILLVDTYESLEGIRAAIRAAGPALKGVRLDSGDLDQLSRAARSLLDAAGLERAIVLASGDLNEHRIQALRRAGAPIDVFGVGTDLVRSRDNPALRGVYKLVYDHDADRPVAKRSLGKASLPGLHQVFRKSRGGRAERDIVGLTPEFHVDSEPLLVAWMQEGQRVRPLPSLAQLRASTRAQLDRLPDALFRLEPEAEGEAYPVELSDALRALTDRVRGDSTARAS